MKIQYFNNCVVNHFLRQSYPKLSFKFFFLRGCRVLFTDESLPASELMNLLSYLDMYPGCESFAKINMKPSFQRTLAKKTNNYISQVSFAIV